MLKVQFNYNYAIFCIYYGAQIKNEEIAIKTD